MIMKSFYSKFRIALMTLAIGLASVWFFKGILITSDISVELPKIKSNSSILYFKVVKLPPSKFGAGSGPNPCQPVECEGATVLKSFE